MNGVRWFLRRPGRAVSLGKGAVRRQIRLWATVVLVLQVAPLMAFLPHDCCPAHKRAARGAESCHETKAATYCPMHHAKAVAPSHSAHGQALEPQATPDSKRAAGDCSMRGTCSGPAAMLALLAQHAVMPDAVRVTLREARLLTIVFAREDRLSRYSPPEPPPPRL
jgi:hypothetical protein